MSCSICSFISEEFNGLDEGQVFRLDTGQIFQQTVYTEPPWSFK